MSDHFRKIAHATSNAVGTPAAFLTAASIIVVWAATGPIFHFSDTWQLVINTGTTVVTFLMVFLIQGSQNRDGLAIQAKLDALIKASAASNEFAGIDQRLSEPELRKLREQP